MKKTRTIFAIGIAVLTCMLLIISPINAKAEEVVDDGEVLYADGMEEGLLVSPDLGAEGGLLIDESATMLDEPSTTLDDTEVTIPAATETTNSTTTEATSDNAVFKYIATAAVIIVAVVIIVFVAKKNK